MKVESEVEAKTAQPNHFNLAKIFMHRTQQPTTSQWRSFLRTWFGGRDGEGDKLWPLATYNSKLK